MFFGFLIFLVLVLGQEAAELAPKNSKRGIVFLFNSTYPTDYQQFTGSSNTITWYYNYGQSPSSQLASSQWEFVPMVWGKDQAKSIQGNINKIKSAGGRVSHILGFNEPDIPRKWGGSDMSPTDAATLWKQYIQPFSSQGIKLCTPGVSSSPDGFTWMSNFFSACSGCTFDLLCLHHYGRPASSLKAHLEKYHKIYPSLPIWLTEFADSKDTADNTRQYISQVLPQLDSTLYIERYSYFGASRELVSNVGPNAALLDNDGKLKPIGRAYFFAENLQA
ncbi:hypothetical protein TWF706_000545 [Orbilia oligospora]|uniref:Asl1-like glycosyl hydrolase catalytic domain-containing protein n=1 Tax=Orbilia oligospora TaxID=2813651 RepID=A0A7C8JM02_ORBOL|nr:hypothetical protein TWF706_000545 [Orbilia oligospora]KAF3130815.1 hypothetical protein TWF703_008092 [Orbilia oligospora]